MKMQKTQIYAGMCHLKCKSTRNYWFANHFVLQFDWIGWFRYEHMVGIYIINANNMCVKGCFPCPNANEIWNCRCQMQGNTFLHSFITIRNWWIPSKYPCTDPSIYRNDNTHRVCPYRYCCHWYESWDSCPNPACRHMICRRALYTAVRMVCIVIKLTCKTVRRWSNTSMAFVIN